jgi:hypothetical protein
MSTKSLHERLERENGLVRGDLMACVEHVQEREVVIGLEHAVLHAADGVQHQRL